MSNLVATAFISRKSNKKKVGVSVFRRENRHGFDDNQYFSVELYEFDENEQFSNFDTLLTQLGPCTLYLPDDLSEKFKNDGKKLNNILHGKDIEVVFMKSTYYVPNKVDIHTTILKLAGKATQTTNSMEMEMPIAYVTLECLIRTQQLKDDDDDEYHGKCVFKYGSLKQYMRLDSAASEAVNLLPKPDHPSQYGSLYGVLNRCVTKMGPKLLERWLRQPLVHVEEITHRQNIVQLLLEDTMNRHKLLDGPLKGLPDLDVIIRKMQKKDAGLDEIFRLYVLSRSLPTIVTLLQDIVTSAKAEDIEEESINRMTSTVRNDSDNDNTTTTSTTDNNNDGTSRKPLWYSLESKIITKLEKMISKFQLYQSFVEHVIDMNELPNLEINPKHDSNLYELRQEKQELQRQAEKLLGEAQSTYASFATVSLETDPRNKSHGIVFRTTKGEDERQLRANKKDIKILSILKNGLHFTTSALESISVRYKEIDEEYSDKQQSIITSAMDTALSYLPLIEACSDILAELDVYMSFATAACYAPHEYVRPHLYDMGTGKIVLKDARHPCVELMDNIQFIPNTYDLIKGQSGFQIITGPNMGGKSTYIRGIGSILIMAQIGSFVPCSEAHITIVDCILARVGAGDAVQKGVSTFMAEMLEASVILNTATSNSLLIIDELGRGTSTYDGFGLAWGISEYISTHIKSFCLFATHFHELTALANTTTTAATNDMITSQCSTDTEGVPFDTAESSSVNLISTTPISSVGIINKHVSGKVIDGQVVMLYNIQDGPCHESFGVHVAAMAQFPSSVIQYAKRKACALEKHTSVELDEEEIEKRRKVLDLMNTFANTPVTSMKANQVIPCLQELTTTGKKYLEY